MQTVGLAGVIIALLLLMYLVYKRINLIFVSMLCVILVAITNQMGILDALKTDYMSGFATFVTNNFLLFVLSAVFGKLMEESGAASAFANLICRAFGKRWAPYGVMIATALLVYGGVSNFVVVFTVFPIFLVVFKESNLPIKLIPGAIFASSATFAASMLPGTPSLNNIMPMQYLDTTPTAAAPIGAVTAVVTMALIFFYFEYEFKKANKKGEGFTSNEKAEHQMSRLDGSTPANPWLSTLPMVALVVCLNLFKLDVLAALAISIILVIGLFYNRIEDKSICFSEGLQSASTAIINTSAAVGFGTVVKATAAFSAMVTGLMAIGGNPIISLGIVTTIISGITGSGTGGIGITMQTFAQKYLELGVHPEVLHRIVAIASNGLDSLPHNGLVITVITACGCTHKESYKPIFVTSVLITIVALTIAIVMGMAMYPIAA